VNLVGLRDSLSEEDWGTDPEDGVEKEATEEEDVRHFGTINSGGREERARNKPRVITKSSREIKVVDKDNILRIHSNRHSDPYPSVDSLPGRIR